MKFYAFGSDKGVGYAAEAENIEVEVVGSEKIPVDEATYENLKKNHKDFEFDREKRTIKRKEPKKEKE